MKSSKRKRKPPRWLVESRDAWKDRAQVAESAIECLREEIRDGKWSGAAKLYDVGWSDGFNAGQRGKKAAWYEGYQAARRMSK